MKKIILTALLFIVAIGSSYAQTLYNVTLDVNGLVFGKTYTDAQMRAALGAPTDFLRDISELGELRRYRYGKPEDIEYFIHNAKFGGFTEFAICSPRFKLFAGRLKVGDNISRVNQLKLGRLVLKSRGLYELFVGVFDIPVTINTDSSGKITSFWTYTPV